jgi:hypothetical protein
MSTLFEKSFHGRKISLVDDEEVICFSESTKHYFASIYEYRTLKNDEDCFKVSVSTMDDYFSDEMWEHLMTALRRVLVIGKELLPSIGLKPKKVWLNRNRAHDHPYQESWEREMASRLRKFGSVDGIITLLGSCYETSFVSAYRSYCDEKFCYSFGFHKEPLSLLAARINVHLLLSKNEIVPTIQEVIKKLGCTKKDYDEFSIPFTMEVIKFFLKAAKRKNDDYYKELVYSNKKLKEICHTNW